MFQVVVNEQFKEKAQRIKMSKLQLSAKESLSGGKFCLYSITTQMYVINSVKWYSAIDLSTDGTPH